MWSGVVFRTFLECTLMISGTKVLKEKKTPSSQLSTALLKNISSEIDLV